MSTMEVDPPSPERRHDMQVDEEDHSKDVPSIKSVEGWVLIVTNIHEEATEEDVYDFFSEFGNVQNLHLNLDRQTGYVKGYALIEYQTAEEAQIAIKDGNGQELLGNLITVDFAFLQDREGQDKRNLRERHTRNRSRSRSRSRSPAS